MGLTSILKTVRDHIAAVTVHGATAAKTANTLMMRDNSGRSKVSDPSAADDIVTKGYLDTQMAGEASARISANVTLSSNISGVAANLAAETNNRKTADTGLQTQINNLSTTVAGLVASGGNGNGGGIGITNSDIVVQTIDIRTGSIVGGSLMSGSNKLEVVGGKLVLTNYIYSSEGG